MVQELSPKGNVMDEVSVKRIWTSLDNISNRLGSIESELKDVVRLQERVHSHDKTLSRYGNRLDEHDNRLRESELWQAHHGDKASVERLITNVQTEVQGVASRVDKLESGTDISTGKESIVKEILKWLSAIVASILLFKLTGK